MDKSPRRQIARGMAHYTACGPEMQHTCGSSPVQILRWTPGWDLVSPVQTADR